MLKEMVYEVSELKDVIYAALKENGGWMTRRSLGLAIGRPTRLTPYDIQLLTELALAGKVEIRHQLVGTARREWQYRAIESEG